MAKVRYLEMKCFLTKSFLLLSNLVTAVYNRAFYELWGLLSKNVEDIILAVSLRLWGCGLITWTEYWVFCDERIIITVMTIFLRISSTDVNFGKC